MNTLSRERVHEGLKTLLLGAVALAVLLALPGIAGWSSAGTARTFSVGAEGKAIATPDLATFTASVITEGTSPERLEESNTKKMDAVMRFVKDEGIEEKDLKTIAYNLLPKYSYGEQWTRSAIIGYTLTQTVQVKVRDLSRVPKIVGGLSKAGANEIGAIQFTVEEPETVQAEARAEAFRKAKEKAKEMAKESGVRIKRVMNFSEYQNGPITPYAAGYAMKAEDLRSDTLPPIQPGENEFVVQISVTYEIW